MPLKANILFPIPQNCRQKKPGNWEALKYNSSEAVCPISTGTAVRPDNHCFACAAHLYLYQQCICDLCICTLGDHEPASRPLILMILDPPRCALTVLLVPPVFFRDSS